MLGRNKNASTGATAVSEAAASPVTETPHPTRPGAKNRPTPKRKDQEAARRRPLVETDRKAAKEIERSKAREARAAQRAAADRGEESALPRRDRGPQKRYIRDRVDARRCLGEVAMPLMVVAIITWVIPNSYVQMGGLALVWVVVLAGIIDAVIMWRSIKKGLIATFGSVESGSAPYAVMRAMQMRRARFPKAQVKRGATVS